MGNSIRNDLLETATGCDVIAGETAMCSCVHNRERYRLKSTRNGSSG